MTNKIKLTSLGKYVGERVNVSDGRNPDNVGPLNYDAKKGIYYVQRDIIKKGRYDIQLGDIITVRCIRSFQII